MTGTPVQHQQDRTSQDPERQQLGGDSRRGLGLGTHNFTQADTAQKVTLTQNSGGKVVADAVKIVRDTGGASNTVHSFTYSYDLTGNQTGITDNSTPASAIANYVMDYDQVNRLTQVQEQTGQPGQYTTQHRTTYDYDAASNLATRNHDGASSAFDYDVRNLLSTQTDKASGSDTSPQVTQFTQYTPDGLLQTEIKPHGPPPDDGNTIAYSYFADGLVQHQKETTPAGATVDEHTYTYTSDGDKNADTEKLMNADGGADLIHALGYSYDPRDRITKVTKDGATAELYTRDASDNVTAQTIGTTPTSFKFDRDRLMSAASGGATVTYNYDPFGRLDTATDPAGNPLETNSYDGFDNTTSHQRNAARSMDTTSYTVDPLNRITSQAVNGATPTSYAYLGLTGDLTSQTTTTGTVNKSYACIPGGQRLYQYTPSQAGNTTSPGYYTYNDHNDVEAVTGTGGTTTATYGYTAYGQPDPGQFTGADKNNAQPSASTTPPFNSYRFNAMRWDSASGQYDMGFRNYAPALNQFLTRDMYNGALNDMQLTTDPFTGNRYTFAAGNPVSNIELDGHVPTAPTAGNGDVTPCWVEGSCPAPAHLQLQPGWSYQRADNGRSGVITHTWQGRQCAGTHGGGAMQCSPVTEQEQFNVGIVCPPRPGVGCMPARDFLTPNQGMAVFVSIMLTAATAGFGAAGDVADIGAAAKELPALGDTSNLLGGYRSFSAAKRALGSPGAGNVFDHTVEQSQIARSGFAPEEINSPYNMNPIPAGLNQAKNAYYSSKQFFSAPGTVRDWLTGQSFVDQYEFSMDVLMKIRNGLPLP